MGRKPDHGQSTRRGKARLGWPANRDGQVAHSHAHSGPTLVSVVFIPLLLAIHDFRDRTSFHCRGVLPPHLFSIYVYAQHVETNTYTKE